MRLCSSGITRRRPPRGEDGFILLESMVALSLITVLMAALASFTLNVVTGTNELRARQGATQLATSTMAALGAVPATDLLTGHDSGSVTDQFGRGAANPAVAPWLTSMDPAVDSTSGVPAGSGATATISTSPTTQVLNNITYAISTYLGRCALRTTSPTAPTDCVVGGAGTKELRAVVAVTWSGRGCRSSSCTFVTATLVNADADPVFNTNRAVPPPKPVVAPPGDQTSTQGGTESLQLTVATGTGLGPFTWQVTFGVLPVGLTLSADGLITGTPTTLVTRTPLTVTVTDAFGRTAAGSFTWTVLGPPTVTTPPAQSTLQGQAVSLAVASTCPNSPCTFALAGAPAGLSINASTGVISGTPTTAGTSPAVVVTTTDADGVAASTAAFTWQVVAPASIASPGTLRSTVGATVGVPVSYTCPVGPCTVTLTGTAPGVGLSTTASSGNNATTTLSVPTGSGTLYLAGTLQTTAVPSGTSKDYAPVLRITSPGGAATTSAAGAWTVFARPTIGAVGTRNATVGSTKDVAVAYTCPNAPCTLTLAGSIPGLGLSATAGRTTANTTTTLTLTATSGTFWISGQVAAGAVPSGTSSKPYVLTATLGDAAGAAVSSSGTWTATTAPRLTNPGSQAVEPFQTASLQIPVDCPNGGCTFSASAQIAGLPFAYPITISSTGRITYANAPPGTYTVQVTVVDSEGISDTISFSLVVQTFTLTIANQATARPAAGVTRTVTIDVSALVRPTADGYTYQLTGAPAYLTMSADGVLTATVTSATPAVRTTGITVQVTSLADPGSNVASTFSWTIS